MLGDEQWKWLQAELESSQAQVHVVVSSVQVLTTNPVMELWGHFPQERKRLLELLNEVPGTILLSGDVHRDAEFLTLLPNNNNHKQQQQSLLMEGTSSGLTHTCRTPF